MKDSLKSITILTPTYNGSKTLGRLYLSLISQTVKDFKWLIVDDGSTDYTESLINSYIQEGLLDIEYYYKENGGKHTALKVGWMKAKTKYLLSIDHDDELTPDAVEVFLNSWHGIEKAGLSNKFAEVSGLTYSQDDKLVGNFHFPDDFTHIDSCWHEMVLKRSNYNEHVVCWNLVKLRQCVNIPTDFWLSDKISHFGDGLFWARIGKRYKTRYLNKKLRTMHLEGEERISRITNIEQICYNFLANYLIFLDENLDHYYWNIRYFQSLILKFVISGIVLKISPLVVLKQIKTFRFKFTYCFYWPIGFFAWIYFKYFKNAFWFETKKLT